MAIALVQTPNTAVVTNGVGTYNVAPSWGSATTTGNLLIGILVSSAAGPQTLPAHTAPAAWGSPIGTVTCDLANAGHRIRITVWIIENAASRSGAETFTSTGAYMGTSLAHAILMEYSGLITASALDKTASAAATGTAETTANSGTTVATTQADELAVAILRGSNGVTLSSITNSFNIQSNPAAYLVVADKILSATGTTSTSMTQGAGSWVGFIATFKAVVSGGGGGGASVVVGFKHYGNPKQKYRG